MIFVCGVEVSDEVFEACVKELCDAGDNVVHSVMSQRGLIDSTMESHGYVNRKLIQYYDHYIPSGLKSDLDKLLLPLIVEKLREKRINEIIQ